MAGQQGARIALGAVALLAALFPAWGQASISVHARGLEPEFRSSVRDYTVDCADPVRLRVRTPGATHARVGAGATFEGATARTITLRAGQAIRIVAQGPKRARVYSIRCMPADVPAFDFHRYARPTSDFYMVTPALAANARYVAMLDRHGVPVWWYKDRLPPFDAKVLDDGTLAWTQSYGYFFTVDPASTYELHRLDGREVGDLRTVGAVTDQHDMQQTADGNYLLISYVPRPGTVDLTNFNGDPSGTVYDGVVQKVSPDGKLLWEWSTEGHVAFSEAERWWPTLAAPPYDYAHVNAIEPLPGGDVLVSARHADAIYRIDGQTGAIEWKLGGTPTPESLNVENDPLGDEPLAGQHDVRYLGHGRISVFDNGTAIRPPRVVRYRIEGNTAMLIDSRSDARVPLSVCCGSARFEGGSVLTSWGGTELITEADRAGDPTFDLEFDVSLSYRAVPVDDVLTRRELRAGMDAQVAPAR